MKVSESLIKKDLKLTEIQCFEWANEQDFEGGQNLPSRGPILIFWSRRNQAMP